MGYKIVWDAAVGVMAGIGALAAFAGAIYALISHGSRYRKWRDTRRERAKTLDKLISSADSLACSAATRQNHTAKLDKLGEKIDSVSARLNLTVEHDKRQDAELARDVEQRKLILPGLYALLDVAHRQGHNGPVTQAHNALGDYLMQQATSAAERTKK